MKHSKYHWAPTPFCAILFATLSVLVGTTSRFDIPSQGGVVERRVYFKSKSRHLNVDPNEGFRTYMLPTSVISL